MKAYTPSFPFNVAAHVLEPITKNVKGVTVKTYAEPNADNLIYCSYKTFGGTEQNQNGVYSVIDTANIETWYTPMIKAECGFCLAETPGEIYEIIGKPENINMSNQFMKFKIQAIKGGA